MSVILIVEDGRLVAFDPDDYAFVVDEKLKREGVYELKVEWQHTEEGDTYKGTLTQVMPPLIKIR